MAEYIDRAAFVGERFTNSAQQLRFREMTGVEAYYEFLRLVNDTPTADVAPVRCGRWIENPFLLGTTHYCSICGENYGMPHGEFNFCSGCGARMDGGADRCGS